MVSLVFLGLAIVCALISRILLLIAAINISAGWAFGVFLPFGPLFFRLNYPEAARNSFLFRAGNPLVRFWFRHLTTANDFTHAQDSSDGDIPASIKANSRVRDGKTGHFEKGSRNSNARPDPDVGPTARGERN
jgi:hypothetical protein